MTESSQINNMSNNINMDISEIQTLLDEDIASKGKKYYHPAKLIVGGKPTKKALAFNRRLIRDGLTTFYLDKSKLVKLNADGSTSIINKPVDKRTKDKRLKKTFTNKHNIIDGTFVSKKGEDVFRYEVDEMGQVGWTAGENTIFSNDLLRYLVQANNLIGNYRIMINVDGENVFDKAYDIKDMKSWWKANGIDFLVDSEFMIWNSNLNAGTVVNIIFTKEQKLNPKYYLQKYLDGKVSHCLLQPILDWATYCLNTAKTSETAKKYKAKILKLVGKKLKSGKDKIGYLEKYKDGVAEDELPKLCEDLQIGMEIEQPFNSNLLFEYKSMKKPLKVFKFVNTRLNHIEIKEQNKKYTDETLFKIGDGETVDSRKELNEIRKQLDDNDEFYIYKKDKYGITSIQTLNNNYKLKNPFSDCVREWEKSQGLDVCSIEGISNSELMKFINDGTHFNGTIDFVETEKFKKSRPYHLKHIDMTKAYTQYKKCKWYDGFTMKITDFRKTDKYYDNGLYLIWNLDFSNCHSKFIKLNSTIGWFEDWNIYTSAELKALESYGAKFNIDCGCWGTKGEFTFSDEMINQKDKVHFGENEFNIPYYSKWAGMNCMINETKNFWFKGDIKYLENINTSAEIYKPVCSTNDEARITYPIKYHFNKKHITAQITAYQRLHMLEQLMNMNIDKLVRICCDGIYYYDHKFKINDTFTTKEKMTFNNSACEHYLSSLILDGRTDWDSFKLGDRRENYRSELFDSAGGDGKTYRNLFLDTGFINVVYAPHSNKLESRMKKDYMEHFGKRLAVSNHSRLLQEPFSLGNDGSVGECYKYNVYIIDECSMLTEEQKEYLLKHIRGKIIFCGDTACQCKPINGEPMTSKGIENIADPSEKNYRFKSDVQLNTCNYVRDCIINGKSLDLKKLPYKKVDKEYVKKNYKKEDIILVSRHKINDEWTETFKNIQKYRVKNNTRDYNNGDIIFEKIKKVETELRHGYTVHSVQGETFKKKIFIDMRKMADKRMFYTAISRAEYDKQIHLII